MIFNKRTKSALFRSNHPTFVDVEFAKHSDKAQRKNHSNGDWRLEYALFPTAGLYAESSSQPKRTIFAFHGFARPLEDMQTLADQWPIAGTVIAVHLPHHGQSGPANHQLSQDSPISPGTLIGLLIEIAENEGLATSQYDLIGYSIGGRVGLALFAEAPNLWNRITLLAPDGLKKSPFYWLTVHTMFGKWIWFAIDRNASIVLKVNDFLLRRKFISNHLHSFCTFHIVDHAMRMMVWRGWRAHRLCWPSHSKITRAAKVWNGQMDIVFGEYDRIIPRSNGTRLQKMNNQNDGILFHVFPSGHGMLKALTVQKLIHRIFPS